VVCAGPRSAEERLAAEVARLRPGRTKDLDPPLRIVVPSESLRRHVARSLTARLGATAGVVVQTIHGLASEIVDRSSGVVCGHDAYFDLLIRRETARESALADPLAELEDGLACAAGTIRDLLDAGLDEPSAEAAEERVEELVGTIGRQAVARAQGLLRAAARVRSAGERTNAQRLADTTHIAAEVLWLQPGVLPARVVLVHGFADVTGLAGDFLQALTTTHTVVYIVDRPPDPAQPGHEDSGCRFLQRFELRLSATERKQDTSLTDDSRRLTAVVAADPEDEALRAAQHARRLLDAGIVPECVAVVARDLAPYRYALRRHFDRLGVPFSGVGCMVPGGRVSRRLAIFGRLLREGRQLLVDLWLEGRRGEDDTDLALGLRVLGIRRLMDLTDLQPSGLDRQGVLLPVGTVDTDGRPKGGRRLPRDGVIRAIQSASDLAGVLDDIEETRDAHGWLTFAHAVVNDLGWAPDGAEYKILSEVLNGLANEIPPGEHLTYGEWLAIVTDRLAEAGELPIGGRGGGVQILSVMEARGRTFDYLLVLGLNRGHFPRVIHEDPLLRDVVRGHLARDVLPDLPVKARGADEERYLFAQLLASAPQVQLSWSSRRDGTRAAPSPFVERLRLIAGLTVEEPAADRIAADPGRLPKPASEHALAAALEGHRVVLRPVMAAHFTEGRWRAGLPVRKGEAIRTAAAQVDVLEALEASAALSGPGPWAGLIGEHSVNAGPTTAVTVLERIATCPWQVFVTRRLAVHPLPDPGGELPRLENLIVGRVVHRVLEQIVRASLGPTPPFVDAVLDSEPTAVDWPSDRELARLVRTVSTDEAHEAGLSAMGIGPLLAERTYGLLQAARQLVFAEGRAEGVVGAEVDGAVIVDEGLVVEFRADRVDRVGASAVLTDYKIGRPISQAVTPSKRRAHLLKRVARGRLLQAAAYARTAPRARGEYLYLRPDIGGAPEETRRVEIEADDAEITAAFESAVRTILCAWRSGVALPRVEEISSTNRRPDHCDYCEVAEACRRDDAEVRNRLITWLAIVGEVETTAASDAARALWLLGSEGTGEAP